MPMTKGRGGLMKTAEIGKVIDQYVGLLSNQSYFEAKKVERLIRDAGIVKKSFSNVNVTEDVNHIYEALCAKGNKIMEEIKQNKQDPKGNLVKAKMYLRYLKAADGDFKGESVGLIQKYFRYYMGTSILFLALSPQYFGFILPALLFVPIFLGIRGIKARSHTGLLLSLSVIPVGLMTSIIWTQYGFSILNNIDGAAAALAQSNGLSGTVAMLLTVVPPMLGVLLFPCAVMTAYYGYKSKDYFI